MKANELSCKDLMTGDWVKVKYSQKRVKVKEIKQSCIYTEGNGYEYNEIEFIPLTPEILEKNGFVKGSYVGGFYSHWCPFRIYIAEGVGFSVLFDDEIHFTCTYIHQLQHALRLCEIEKEIEL